MKHPQTILGREMESFKMGSLMGKTVGNILLELII
jgi:hypothetical protein